MLFWVPGRPRLAGDTWQVETSHFAERFGLFVIIALGESIVITGATTAELELDFTTVAAFAGAFLGTAALWWLYFTSIARVAERALAAASDRTLLARDAYTYGHVLIIAGIVLTAVGVAQAALRLRMTGGISVRRLTGALACVLVGIIGAGVSALLVGALLIAVLVGVIIADQIARSRRAGSAAAGANSLARTSDKHRCGRERPSAVRHGEASACQPQLTGPSLVPSGDVGIGEAGTDSLEHSFPPLRSVVCNAGRHRLWLAPAQSGGERWSRRQ